jgi:hypothetical protein
VSIGFGPSAPQGEPAVARRTFNVLDWGFMCVNDKENCDFDGTSLLVRAFRGTDFAHDIDLNIRFDTARGVWRGNFTQDKLTFEAEFQRPHRGRDMLGDPLVGDWRNIAYPEESPYCLHVRQQSDGELLIWNDFTWHYGVRLSPIRLSPSVATEPNAVRFQTVSSYGNGLHFFEGVLNTDRTRFEGYWNNDDQVEHPKWSPAVRSVFVRSEGQTCAQH